ncbi:hypothetical protein DCC39_15190 [Pueribacillus theae]|uniref:Uncharacterized protein n=1 Tax=Pueribacillus theae TaxID=2171751 RepID=A0A2U1JSU1_9BACI|nr:hypothetical protein [Pueribacillus theae]PWA08277.1 hypothetical protein DCC39_15190 [Pueribacillus theae]
MKKRLYYVSVETGDIMQTEVDDNQQYFEIAATDDELNELKALIKDLSYQNLSVTASNMFVHFFENEKHDEDNDRYTNKLYHVYKKIYDLGTPKTKQQFQEMK